LRQVVSQHSPAYEALLAQGWNVSSVLENGQCELEKFSSNMDDWGKIWTPRPGSRRLVKAHPAPNDGHMASLIPVKIYFPTQSLTEETNKKEEPPLSKTRTMYWKAREKPGDPGRYRDFPAREAHDSEPASVGSAKLPATPPSRFLRGDVDQNGQVSIRDAAVLLKWIYDIGSEPSCLESADVNNDGEIGSGDALQIINYTIHRLTPPAGPFPVCDEDPDRVGDDRDLGCDSYEACLEEVEEKEKEEDEEEEGEEKDKN